MDDLLPATAISPLRQRLIDDMALRRFSCATQRNYIVSGVLSRPFGWWDELGC